MDLKILVLTVCKVLKREDVGVDKGDTSTFEEFRKSQWLLEGRADLIKEAHIKSLPYLSMINRLH